MRPLLIVTVIVLLAATTSQAQAPGKIGVYADAAGTSINVVDVGQDLEVYLLHVMTDGATASEFKLDVSATGWVHLGDEWAFELVIGNSQEGVSIAYQECLSGSIYLGKARFTGASAPACTEINIVPDPLALAGEVLAVDCAAPMDRALTFPAAGRAFVNGNADGTCNVALPVEETTWGGIKSLYR